MRAVGAVGQPHLALVGRQADAVARAAVPLHRALLEARAPRRGAASCRSSRSPTSNPSRSLTLTKQSVCAPLTVNGRMTLPNGPTSATTACVARVGDRAAWRLQAGEVHAPAVGAVDRVVRAGFGHDRARSRRRSRASTHVPVRPLERRHVEQSCRRARSPCDRSRRRRLRFQTISLGREVEGEHAL